MDIISKVLRLGGDLRPIKVSILVNCFEYLCSSIKFTGIEDVKESVVKNQETNLTGAEFDLYVSLMTESLLVPFLYFDGSLRLRIRDFNGDELLYLNEIYLVLSMRSNQSNARYIELFKTSVAAYGLEKNKQLGDGKWGSGSGGGGARQQTTPNSYSQILCSNIQSDLGGDIKRNSSVYSPLSNNNSSSSSSHSSGNSSNSNSHTGSSSNNNQLVKPSTKKAAGGASLEKNEYIIKFLARVRKQGMDMLFPQVTHDRVVACIYSSMLLLKSPAHRELIDIVMEIKESGSFFDASESDSISKTKIRGLLALLKHSDILKTKGLEGQPVELILNLDCANSFMSLREKHDQYIFDFIFENKIVIPRYLYQEIIWAEPKENKLKAIEIIIAQISSTYKDLIHDIHQKAINSEDFGGAKKNSDNSSTGSAPSPPRKPSSNHANHALHHHEDSHNLKQVHRFGSSQPVMPTSMSMQSMPSSNVMSMPSSNVLSLPSPNAMSMSMYRGDHSNFNLMSAGGGPFNDSLQMLPPSRDSRFEQGEGGGGGGFINYPPPNLAPTNFSSLSRIPSMTEQSMQAALSYPPPPPPLAAPPHLLPPTARFSSNHFDDILNPPDPFNSPYSLFADLSNSASNFFDASSTPSSIKPTLTGPADYSSVYKPYSSSVFSSDSKVSLHKLSVEVSDSIHAMSMPGRMKDLSISPSILKYSSSSFNQMSSPHSTTSDSNSNNTSFSSTTSTTFSSLSSDLSTSTMEDPLYQSFERIFGSSPQNKMMIMKDMYSLTPDKPLLPTDVRLDLHLHLDLEKSLYEEDEEEDEEEEEEE